MEVAVDLEEVEASAVVLEAVEEVVAVMEEAAAMEAVAVSEEV